MGRSYIYECQKCGYRAIVSGRSERGVNFAVTTIQCFDCKELRDAVTAVRLSESEIQAKDNPSRPIKGRMLRENWNLKVPPTADAVFNRLLVRGGGKYRWVRYDPRCSVPQSTASSHGQTLDFVPSAGSTWRKVRCPTGCGTDHRAQ
jgi:hypothetical protein